MNLLQPIMAARTTILAYVWNHLVFAFWDDSGSDGEDVTTLIVNGDYAHRRISTRIQTPSEAGKIHAFRAIEGLIFFGSQCVLPAPVLPVCPYEMHPMKGMIDEVTIYDLDGLSQPQLEAKLQAIARHYTVVSEPDTLTSLAIASLASLVACVWRKNRRVLNCE